MYRIKSITYVLKCLGMISLSAAIKPDRNQGKQCKSLLYDLQLVVSNLDRIVVAAEDLEIDVIQADQLTCKAPPFAIVEEVENQYGYDADSEIIDHGNGSKQQVKQ